MPTDSPLKLLRGAPYFPVADYSSTFGFKTEYIAGQPAEFAIVSRDGCALMFRRVTKPERIRPMESQGGTWDAFFWVSDADALAAELTARGASFVYPVTVQPYGTKEFAVRDADGHVLGFGQDAAG
jgi:uncharacterized glyoxalase superfamily protein PhnB